MPVSHTGDAGSNPARGTPPCDRGVRTEAHGVASAADRVRVPAVALAGLLMVGTVACTHPRGVRFPGAPLSSADRVPLAWFSLPESTRLSDAPGGATRLSPGRGGFDSRRERSSS